MTASPDIVKYEAIEAHLDWDRIKLATRGGEPDKPMFASVQDGNALKMVERALRRWAPRDLYTMEIIGIEEHFELDNPGKKEYNPVAHGYIDLRLALRNEWKQLKGEMLGQEFIVDWKTTRSTLDATWATRLRTSWQWKLYAAAKGVKYMIYRGIHVREGEREEILALPPVEDLQEIVLHQWEQYRRNLELNNEFTSERHPSWNRHMPFACGAYGSRCPYADDCESQTAPFVIIPPEILFKPISYSSGERMSLCPERHRRYIISREGLDITYGKRDDIDDTEESLLGSAVHRGLQEAYTQLRELRKQGSL